MSFTGRYIFQIVGAIIAVVYVVVGIFKSTNSTAPIGFLFVPLVAAFGAFVGDAIKYFLDVLQKNRPHAIGKTVLILAVFGFCTYKFIQTQMENRVLLLAESGSLSSSEFTMLLQKNNARITHALVSNPSIPTEGLEKIVDEHLVDYYIMSKAILHPSLSAEKMKQIVSLERSDFKGDAEYELYQAQVWTRLAGRKDVPEALIHTLTGKNNPEHFLILALLESPFVSCEEKKQFLPQSNEVLESAIRHSIESQKCSID